MKRFIALFAVAALYAATSLAATPSPPSTIIGVVETVTREGHLIFAGGDLRVDVLSAELAEGTSLDDIAPGDRVQVTLADGLPLRALRVREIHLPDLDVFGTVDSVDVNAGTITVVGVTFAVTGDTQIVRGDPKSASLADFRTGDPVHVTASLSDRQLVASSVVAMQRPSFVPPRPSRPNEVTFDGVVTSISGDDWMIGGQHVLVTPRTQVQGKPKIGDKVRVHGLVFPSALLALRVTKL